ncbi:MAG TPA: hypothetical protein VMU69_08335 [Bradyrhizobium sp.]|nr:hypothetical protein [Bradyrhizobium sp.]
MRRASDGPPRWSAEACLADLGAAIARLRPGVEAHITEARVRRYLLGLAETPAPSTAAAALALFWLTELDQSGPTPVRKISA